jgi:hypothetical protein
MLRQYGVRNKHTIPVAKFKDNSILSKWILPEKDVNMWIEFIWLRIKLVS